MREENPKWQPVPPMYRFSTDELYYMAPSRAGTVPMLFIATGGDKTDPTGTETDGIAKYTKPINLNISASNQRELTQYFGNVLN